MNRKAISSSLSLCLLMLAGPRLASLHVTAHCGPNELPEAQAEYLMRPLSMNGYCDQRRVPVHLAEGLDNGWPYCWVFQLSRRPPYAAQCLWDPSHSLASPPKQHLLCFFSVFSYFLFLLGARSQLSEQANLC